MVNVAVPHTCQSGTSSRKLWFCFALEVEKRIKVLEGLWGQQRRQGPGDSLLEFMLGLCKLLPKEDWQRTSKIKGCHYVEGWFCVSKFGLLYLTTSSLLVLSVTEMYFSDFWRLNI